MDKISIGALQNLTNSTPAAKTTPYEAQESFKSFLKGALENINETQADSNKATQELMNGNMDNLHQVMITAEKASVTLQTTLEIRNKVVEAYQEIMRMQV
ncbi:flagellar hook-basal body complex protein FliE [Fictibacillus barbaricus]|jgi:flagellar hook-basal body complex protein FliE|uniref:Flagellar hook-basal body complex protein FliE n=1 Tax=Fictibacillus barbaricus TaxID=182136 RepID=A0ABS2ZDJ7_9BACL|nr:flagellar hook-basal body complex protein FliE [Fictibacillus barbaricus]MBN3545851.1 flagellar hook-basal body complex protein FliE [Fictibacillus barbaricus]GGB56647.1 flagellar hook-basal body complex protein FliE [Fictibacillus barbaricus]